MAGDAQSDPTDDGPGTYVSTPNGLVSRKGHWYHIREEDLRAYADEVLNHVSVEQLIRYADAWIGSPRTLALWSLPVLLWVLPAAWAIATTLGIHVVWALFSPAASTLFGAWLVSGLENVFVQGGYYVLALSIFAGMEQFGAVGIGLVAFALFRWGVLGWIVQAVVRPVRQWMYPLPVADQVLRGLIVRAALKYRESVPQVDALTEDILENWMSD